MWLRGAIVLVIGTGGTLVASWSLGGSAGKTIELAARASGAAVAVGLAGTIGLILLRGRSLTTQMTVITLTTVGAVAAGAMLSGSSAIIKEHAISALAVVVISSGTVGIVVGLYLTERVSKGSAQLAEAARSIGRGEPEPPLAEPPTEELAELARELDLTSRRLEESRTRTTALEDSRRELVAWVSHDLRTPLSRIRAVVEALQDGIVSDPAGVADYLQRIHVEADRLSGLVDGLFELSRINAGSLALDLQPTQLADVVSDLVAAFSVLAEARDVTLRADLPESSPVVLASMEHLERALSNLIDNAVRYSEEGAVVRIGVGTSDAGAYVTIEDGCGGMTAVELERLFDMTVARNLARRSNSGTGLGLAIAKGLIEAHDGTVAVENTATGCRFMVKLPAVGMSPMS